MRCFRGVALSCRTVWYLVCLRTDWLLELPSTHNRREMEMHARLKGGVSRLILFVK